MMDVTVGLFDHMVLQRAGRGTASVAVRGVTDAVGEVLATVSQRGKARRGVQNCVVGRARAGSFTAKLPALPTGGPYTVALQVVDTAGRRRASCTVRDVLVGDVWIAAGQSNMQGCGHLNHPLKPVAAVRAFTMDDRWSVARDPIHNMWESVDPVHALLCGGSNPPKPAPNWGTCPAVAFAQAMYADSGVPQGILACAHGGTSMTQWDPAAAAREGNRCLYGALRRRLQKNGGRVAGMIWYQGCSDASTEAAPHYTPRMQALIAALRHDGRDARLPVVVVQIARVTAWGAGEAERAWNSIQEQQRRLPEHIRHLAVVPAIDLPLDDGIHISEAGQVRLGYRLAYAMQALTGAVKGRRPPLAVGDIQVVSDSFGRGMVEVSFEHVVGELSAGGCRPTGFSFEGAPMGTLYDTELEGSRVRLRTGVPAAQIAGWRLWYGRGVDPYVNVTDGADRSLPVFGPLRIGQPRAIAPAVDRALVSDLLPGAGDLTGVALPKDFAATKLRPRSFPDGFLNLRPEFAACGGADRLAFFVIRFRCAEAMRLSISLGYDGPMKAWLDRQDLAADPEGTNPCVLGKRQPQVQVGAGTHELVVALGSHGGLAWGVMVQFERLDLSPEILEQDNPSLYRLPELEG